MNKPLLAILLASGIAFISYAEEEPENSPATYTLNEIEVKASKVIRKADMDVFYPSAAAVDNSTNGLQLLTNVMIPSVFVDEVMGKISSSGNDVQIRINGRVASVEQVRNLSPESVKRIEWIDNPGLRYNGADFVLNFIVSNPDAGGNLSFFAQPMLNALFGNYNASLKLNHGKSQWEISAFFKPAEIEKVHRDYYESFTFPDGERITRRETPLGGEVRNYQGYGKLGYSYIKPDTTIFYATLSAWSDLDNLGRFNGLLSVNDDSNDINLLNITKSKGVTPTLSIYLEQHFQKRQYIVVDFSSSVFTGYSSSLYQENFPEEDTYLTDIYTHIRDFNQAYAIEADYIKNWRNSKLTAGVNYSANRNRSKYRNLDNAVFHQNQDKLYFFGEYFQRLGKVTLTGGVGAQYTSFKFKETNQGSSSWNLRPQATITYSPNGAHQLRLNFTTWQTAPTLAETNIVAQQTDGFQWNVGNPDLKTYNSFKLDLRYGFQFWRVAGNLNVSATTMPKSIAPYLYWEGDKLITSYENSKGKQSLSFSLAPQVQVIPNWLTVSGYIEYLNERTQGKGYKLYNHNLSGNVSVMATHWNFTFVLQYNKMRRSLWGEKLSWGEDMSAVALLYNWNKWQFGALMFMPFSKYDQGSKMLSKWNTNETHLRLDFRMVGVQVNYNLQWGKQKRGVQKLIETDANVEKSTAKTR